MNVLAWGDWVYVYSGRYLGVCCVLLVFLVRYDNFSVFLWFFVLVLVRLAPCPRQCMIYYMDPDPRYCGGPICTL